MTDPDDTAADPAADRQSADAPEEQDPVAALRSLPNRYREVLGGSDTEGDRDLAHRPDALEQAARARDLLDTTARRVERLVEDARPVAEEAAETHAPRRGPAQWDPDVVLSVLDSNAERVARLVENIPQAAQDRPRVREGLESLTGEIVHEAVSESQRALKETERVIEEDPEG